MQKMSENDAIFVLKRIEAHGSLPIKAKEVAIQALEEIQQYRAIGTLDECREAVERMEPKKARKIQIPNTSWSKAQIRFECPSCHKYLNYKELCFCGLCGQKLLWEE